MRCNRYGFGTKKFLVLEDLMDLILDALSQLLKNDWYLAQKGCSLRRHHVAGHEETLRWLDRQAPSSIVYAAFGSEVKLTSEQLQRIPLGLEASGLPFIWAFRVPADAGDSDRLPDGFEQRVNGRRVICGGWLPQVRFLAHGSVRGFLTHAGWNSIAEGLTNGVRLVLLPLVFEQGLNARHLAEKKIAVEVARDEEDEVSL
ncbi:hypothetical protein E2562_029013 [Oryza meyeriana var. granulata]|uniref:UDP-glycosyltransferases domain-containing protein n=1 Tax=Oryza meyeriana var. granulata TaxID=110450 RepID=A0A6G1E427_9ORYZ|nr:hypothetical protein E2562_029013 [Oryza meyeriana var. granulata]